MVLRAFVVTAAALVVVACGGNKTPRHEVVRVHATTNSLVLVDAADDRVLADVRVGGTPRRVAFDDGAFWTAAPKAGLVVRVNARTHEATRFRVGEDPFDVAVGGGAVWVPDHDRQVLYRLDPQTGRTRATASLGGPVVTAAYGLGAAWAVVAPGDLKRIDPKTLGVTHTTPNVASTTEEAEPKLLFTRDRLLVVSPSSAWIARVDASGASKGKRNVNGLTGGTLARGALWLGNSAGFVVGNGMRAHVGYSPRDLAGDGDAVWVAVYNESRVKRVDADDGHVVATIRLNRAPVAVAAGDGVVAVAVTAQL